MIFSSYQFIFLFLPVVLLGYHLLRHWGNVAGMKGWLVLASLVFYGLGQPEFVLGFLGIILANYLLVTLLHRVERTAVRRLLLAAAVLLNLGLLGYYKYANFFLENLNLVLGTDFALLSTILPIGISFFTFQILMYTVSFYRGECGYLSFLDYTLFITFFPQLIVGPVVKEDEIVPQIQDRKLLEFSGQDVCRGVMLFCVGCGKKILLANPMIDFAIAFYGGQVAQATTVEAWATWPP